MSIAANSITRRVLLVGNSGHARVCVEALRESPRSVVIGAVSRHPQSESEFALALLGRDDDLETVFAAAAATHAFIGIGDNEDRWRWMQRCQRAGIPLDTAVSDAATVSRSADVDAGAFIGAGAVICATARIGAGAIINTNASVDHDCLIGAAAHVAPACALAGGVSVGQGALVGIGARVLPGLSIGAWAVVGAGAVVTRSVPDGVTVAGVPARVLEVRQP